VTLLYPSSFSFTTSGITFSTFCAITPIDDLPESFQSKDTPLICCILSRAFGMTLILSLSLSSDEDVTSPTTVTPVELT